LHEKVKPCASLPPASGSWRVLPLLMVTCHLDGDKTPIQ